MLLVLQSMISRGDRTGHLLKTAGLLAVVPSTRSSWRQDRPEGDTADHLLTSEANRQDPCHRLGREP